jgi:hypothetical protein
MMGINRTEEEWHRDYDDVSRRNGWNNGRKFHFKLRRFKDIEINTKPDYVIKGLIPGNAFVVIWGPPKSGKSFTAFDMSMHVAGGFEYRGHRVRQGPVVYCALEGGGGFARRVKAWGQAHEAELRGLDPPFYLMNVPMALVAEQDELIQDIEGQLPTDGQVRTNGRLPTPPLSTVIIDTLNRALGDLDENSSDMAKLVAAADAIRQHFKCTVIIVHHSGIDATRPRGHTSLRGAVDALIAVAKETSGLITVTVQEMRDDEPPPPFACRLERLEIACDDEGASIYSMVARPANPTRGASSSASKITAHQQRFLDILAEAVLMAPLEHKTYDNIPDGRIAITREWLKRCCITKGFLDREDRDNNQRAKLSNMITKLAGKHLIDAEGDYVWDARN